VARTPGVSCCSTGISLSLKSGEEVKPLSLSSSTSVADVSSDVLETYESMDPGTDDPDVWPDNERRKWPSLLILPLA
jgi:hypothetical protein